MRGLLCGVVAVIGTAFACNTTQGPPSVERVSSASETLESKREFLERYVTFRRTYEQLSYSVSYHDNSSGCVPGPSDTDIALVAEVPPAELDLWVDGLDRVQTRPPRAPALHSQIPVDGVTDWFEGSNKVVGVDLSRGIVVYRVWSH